jgi:hypothetical protein
MELPDKNFTITMSALPPDFSQKYSPETSVSRAVDSRYWETRMPVISEDLAKEVFTSVTTDDTGGDFTWH